MKLPVRALLGAAILGLGWSGTVAAFEFVPPVGCPPGTVYVPFSGDGAGGCVPIQSPTPGRDDDTQLVINRVPEIPEGAASIVLAGLLGVALYMRRRVKASSKLDRRE